MTHSNRGGKRAWLADEGRTMDSSYTTINNNQDDGEMYDCYASRSSWAQEESSDREEAKDVENAFIGSESSREIEPDSGKKETKNGSGSDQEDEKQSSGTSENSNEDDVETDPDTHDEAEL